ncbi:hypothetical protein FD04_GL002063 [Secundilactobacillus odoratitofui DSM 19909 = JCM 15043]|uniref:Uncharacterized protein n=1 Tax=Secundilactobacillus odoratitofui DSM 19909 = JCM 15043 TaxID=1423776 RepID=A0A0R1LW61_9LACO|nr:hypothetical protein FD04_GL002063 [Secundilactobacillus odoratitofui DSM 19909 = JCM 15043]
MNQQKSWVTQRYSGVGVWQSVGSYERDRERMTDWIEKAAWHSFLTTSLKNILCLLY